MAVKPKEKEMLPEELKTSTALGAPMSDDDFFDIPTGMEDVDNADVTLPRYSILQGLSPQVNDRKDEYIEGAKMGMILNTATGKVMDKVTLVMAAYQRRNVEWIPRDKPCPLTGFPQVTGGGLYRDYGTDEEILSECTENPDNASLWTPRGHELVVTGTWYVLDPETLSLGFMAMGKTQFTSSKKLMAGIRDEKLRTTQGIRPAPLFYRAWEITTRLREHEGNEWFVFQHKPAYRIQEHENGRAILEMVREVSRTIASEDMKIDMSVGETEGQSGSSKGDNARM